MSEEDKPGSDAPASEAGFPFRMPRALLFVFAAIATGNLLGYVAGIEIEIETAMATTWSRSDLMAMTSWGVVLVGAVVALRRSRKPKLP